MCESRGGRAKLPSVLSVMVSVDTEHHERKLKEEAMSAPSVIRQVDSVDVKKQLKATMPAREVQEMCESRGGRPGLPVRNRPYGLCGRKATLNLGKPKLGSCVKVEVAVLGSPSITVLVVSVDVKHHERRRSDVYPVPNKPDGFC